MFVFSERLQIEPLAHAGSEDPTTHQNSCSRKRKADVSIFNDTSPQMLCKRIRKVTLDEPDVSNIEEGHICYHRHLNTTVATVHPMPVPSITARKLALTRITTPHGSFYETENQLHARLRMAAELESALMTPEKEHEYDSFQATYPPDSDLYIMGGNPTCLQFYTQMRQKKCRHLDIIDYHQDLKPSSCSTKDAKSRSIKLDVIIKRRQPNKIILQPDQDADDPIESFSDDDERRSEDENKNIN